MQEVPGGEFTLAKAYPSGFAHAQPPLLGELDAQEPQRRQTGGRRHFALDAYSKFMVTGGTDRPLRFYDLLAPTQSSFIFSGRDEGPMKLRYGLKCSAG